MTFHRVNSCESAKKRFFKGHVYGDKITENLEANKKKAAHYKVEMFHFEDGIFQVTTGRVERESSKGSHTHTVNFKHKTCTCMVIRISILINDSTILRSKIRRPIRIVGRILMLVESYDPT